MKKSFVAIALVAGIALGGSLVGCKEATVNGATDTAAVADSSKKDTIKAKQDTSKKDTVKAKVDSTKKK